MSKILIIGGGAAGMFASIAAAENGHEVHVFEKNEKPGRKIYITGKGRCNLTNACDMEKLLESVCRNRKFLYSAFYGCSNQDVIAFFERHGMQTKTERGERVFPMSDKSADVIDTLRRAMKAAGVYLHVRSEVSEILTMPNENNPDITAGTTYGSEGETKPSGTGGDIAQFAAGGEMSSYIRKKNEKLPELRKNIPEKKASGGAKRKVVGVRLSNGKIFTGDCVLVATGGFSYQSTGSTGDGYLFARACGHTVTELRPSLVPFETREAYIPQMQGLSLKNVALSIYDGRKCVYQDFGEMMFTHFGVTGPMILTASTAVSDRLSKKELRMEIDLKPALTTEQLDHRLLREFTEGGKKQLKSILGHLLPAKMVPVMMGLSEIAPEKQVNEITREERERLLNLVKHFPLTATGLRDYNEAIVTRGGVTVKEVDPSTMESKLVQGLYFAGEVLDLDGVTGGFNLQIAWSTGYAAGRGMR